MNFEDYLKSPASHVTTLLALLLDRYGTDVLGWEPETIASTLEEMRATPLTIDKCQAGIVVLTTDQLYRSMESFNALCGPFNGHRAVFNTFDPPDMNETVWLVSEASLMLGDEYRPDWFSSEVRAYVGMILHDSGVRNAHKPMEWAVFPDVEIDEAYAGALARREMRAVEEARSYVDTRLYELINQLDQAPFEHGEEWNTVRERVLTRMRPAATV